MPIYNDVNALYKINNQPLVLEDLQEQIGQQISNIIMTPLGSREFEPNYGSNCIYRLFEPIDTFTSYELEVDIFVALDRQMRDRIQLDKANCRVTPQQEGFQVYLSYYIIDINKMGTFNKYISL